jgi:hypothetical protein
MPITINGSGSIAGISVGGLENGCVNSDDLATAAVTETKLASNAVTIDKLGTTLQSQVCKAWVNFNGTGTVAIRASYNVSSITDNGVGQYTVNFATSLADDNYCAQVSSNFASASGWIEVGTSRTNSGVSVVATTHVNFTGDGRTFADYSSIYVAIFR